MNKLTQLSEVNKKTVKATSIVLMPRSTVVFYLAD